MSEIVRALWDPESRLLSVTVVDGLAASHFQRVIEDGEVKPLFRRHGFTKAGELWFPTTAHDVVDEAAVAAACGVANLAAIYPKLYPSLEV